MWSQLPTTEPNRLQRLYRVTRGPSLRLDEASSYRDTLSLEPVVFVLP